MPTPEHNYGFDFAELYKKYPNPTDALLAIERASNRACDDVCNRYMSCAAVLKKEEEYRRGEIHRAEVQYRTSVSILKGWVTSMPVSPAPRDAALYLQDVQKALDKALIKARAVDKARAYADVC